MKSKLRVIATVFAAAVFAVGLSVGAALAEDMGSGHTPKPVSAAENGSHWSLSGVCLLDGKSVKPPR